LLNFSVGFRWTHPKRSGLSRVDRDFLKQSLETVAGETRNLEKRVNGFRTGHFCENKSDPEWQRSGFRTGHFCENKSDPEWQRSGFRTGHFCENKSDPEWQRSGFRIGHFCEQQKWSGMTWWLMVLFSDACHKVEIIVWWYSLSLVAWKMYSSLILKFLVTVSWAGNLHIDPPSIVVSKKASLKSLLCIFFHSRK